MFRGLGGVFSRTWKALGVLDSGIHIRSDSLCCFLFNLEALKVKDCWGISLGLVWLKSTPRVKTRNASGPHYEFSAGQEAAFSINVAQVIPWMTQRFFVVLVVFPHVGWQSGTSFKGTAVVIHHDKYNFLVTSSEPTWCSYNLSVAITTEPDAVLSFDTALILSYKRYLAFLKNIINSTLFPFSKFRDSCLQES